MTNFKPTLAPVPFAWPGDSREEWEELHRRRRRARLSLVLSSIPGVVSAGAASLDVGADTGHRAWLAFGAMLETWWDERRELEALRKAFWVAYREDPWRLVPPAEEEALRAPWE